MKLDINNYLELLDVANKSDNGLARLILHTHKSEKVQLMIIAIKEGVVYPPISDQDPGWIVFSVIKGSLIINTYEYNHGIKKATSSNFLKQGEIIKLKRDIYRETICNNQTGTIYMEIIEGKFDRRRRRILMNK